MLGDRNERAFVFTVEEKRPGETRGPNRWSHVKEQTVGEWMAGGLDPRRHSQKVKASKPSAHQKYAGRKNGPNGGQDCDPVNALGGPCVIRKRHVPQFATPTGTVFLFMEQLQQRTRPGWWMC